MRRCVDRQWYWCHIPVSPRDGVSALIGALGTIKGETAERVAMIELVQLRLAELTAQLDLVLADHPRKVIGEVAGDVVAAFGRRLADGIEAADVDVGRTRKYRSRSPARAS